MSQLLLGATIVLLILVGLLSADIMGFSFWKSNAFPVEGKVYCIRLSPLTPVLTMHADRPPHRFLPGNG